MVGERQIELVYIRHSTGKADAKRTRGSVHGRVREERLALSWSRNELRIVPLGMLVATDESLKPIVNLPVGKGLWRDSVSG